MKEDAVLGMCLCSLVFPSTHLFSVLSRLRHEIRRELENFAYK